MSDSTFLTQWETLGWVLPSLVVLLTLVYQKKIRRWYYLYDLPRAIKQQWHHLPVHEHNGLLDVACRECPKFARFPARCTVPFGSPMRKCIMASTEYHMADTAGKFVLEIGCGAKSHARTVVENCGGYWVGLEPAATRHGVRSIRTVGGVVQQLPFRDHVFDVICGIQTLEHWEEPGSRFCIGGYQEILYEVWRVLKPGGWIYLDAPIHVHGAPEFVRGELDKIRNIFTHQNWRNVRMMSWRRLHEPLRPRRPPKSDQTQWTRTMADSTAAERAELAQKTAWVIAIRAEKPMS